MVRITDLKTAYTPITKTSGNVYIISWDYVEDGDEESILASWTYEKFSNLPSFEYIKSMISDYYNLKTDAKIISEFIWEEKPVWLSSENQFNFKAAYDLAKQTNGANLPVTFKLGEIDDIPVYHTFETIKDLEDFYLAAVHYIQQCLNDGWNKKDSVDWEIYKQFYEDELSS